MSAARSNGGRGPGAATVPAGSGRAGVVIGVAALAGILIGLCGCSQGIRDESGAHGVRLNGVDLGRPLTLQGTEPFWSLRIADGVMRWDEGGVHLISGPPRVSRLANTATWTARLADGEVIRATVTADKCSDGMGPHDYPLAARVRLGARDYGGCADLSESLELPETGSPDDALIAGVRPQP